MTRGQILRMAEEAGFFVGESWRDAPIVRFAALVAAAEREEIMDEWWGCVQSDLENGFKSLNERAVENWYKEYPAIAGFADAIKARRQK